MPAVASEALLADLTPRAEELMERHLATCKPWYPHEVVPWSMGRDFAEGEAWDPNDFPLPDAVRSALYLNLLTEDNLPYYFETINRVFGSDDVWGAWSKRWVAEEARHSIAIRDYLTVTRAVDPVVLEDGRISQMSGGQVPQPADPRDGFAYVALQELATRISHHNTGRLLQGVDHPGAAAGYEVMKRVGADENFHYLFYRDVTTACIEADPSGTVMAIERQVKEFEMPGTGIPSFKQHADAIAKAGIYDLKIHHDQILQAVVVRHWKLESIEGLNAEAEQSRERILRHISRLGRLGERLAARQAANEARREPAQAARAS